VSSLAQTLGHSFSDHPLKQAFLRWQCRVRQIAMRDGEGRPDEAITPEVFLPGDDAPLGAIITIMNKAPGYSVTAEMNHMVAKTNDPAQRREQALTFFSATYYQKHQEFSDILSATFPPGSPGAARIRDAGRCRLVFAAYAQSFDLDCKVWRLAPHNPLFQSTFAHNRLFNPALHPETEILGFEPDWDASSADPGVA
jgi:hypothetical protein